MKNKIMIDNLAIERIENSFWKAIRIRYWLRRKKHKQDDNDYDIELLLNTVQILKSEIEALKKKKHLKGVV